MDRVEEMINFATQKICHYTNMRFDHMTHYEVAVETLLALGLIEKCGECGGESWEMSGPTPDYGNQSCSSCFRGYVVVEDKK